MSQASVSLCLFSSKKKTIQPTVRILFNIHSVQPVGDTEECRFFVFVCIMERTKHVCSKRRFPSDRGRKVVFAASSSSSSSSEPCFCRCIKQTSPLFVVLLEHVMLRVPREAAVMIDVPFVLLAV